MRASAMDVAGVTLLADFSGALVWEEQSLLVVSDLHLEKGSSFAARGVLLPPYDTVATLSRLAAVIARTDHTSPYTDWTSGHNVVLDRYADQEPAPGGALAGAQPWREKSGDGVSLASGHRAAELILEEN